MRSSSNGRLIELHESLMDLFAVMMLDRAHFTNLSVAFWAVWTHSTFLYHTSSTSFQARDLEQNIANIFARHHPIPSASLFTSTVP